MMRLPLVFLRGLIAAMGLVFWPLGSALAQTDGARPAAPDAAKTAQVPAQVPAQMPAPWSDSSDDKPPPPWRVLGLPQSSLPLTQYKVVTLDGQRVMQVSAVASYASLAHALPANTQGRRLAWRWRLDEPNLAADLRQKSGDDNPLKVCVSFAMPTSAVPFFERQILRLARSRTGEDLPAATICYVWDSRLEAGTRLDNVYSRRVRMLVLRGPESPLKTWQAEQRDVRADFLRLFGDEASTVPPLLAVLVGADADNTQGRSLGYVGALNLE